MFKTLLAAAATLVALPGLADEVRVAAPIEAGSIRAGDVTLVAYFVPTTGDAYEVTATWLGDDDAEARRLVMRLEEGDAVGFSLPGHLGTLFTFSRDFDAVTVRAEPAQRAARRSASL